MIEPPQGDVEEEEAAKQKIAALEREAKLLGNTPEASILFHEAGRLWEEPLRSPRNAAVAYQNAHRLAPDFLPNIRDARRLFEGAGNWQMVLQLLDAELTAASQVRQRALLLLQKANVLEEHLARRNEATRTYQEVLSLRPKDVPILMQLEDIYGARGDRASLVEVYKLLAELLEDAGLRAYYLTSAGYLLEEHLGQAQQGGECFYQAFALERRDPLLLSAVIRVAEKEGRSDELLAALAAQAGLEGLDASHTYMRISKVYERLGRKEDALAALLAARRINPQEELVLSQLADIYESESRYQELTDVLLSWVESIHDQNEMVGLNLRLAALYEEVLKRDEDAIGRYRAILARVPGESAALTGLGRLYYRTKNWAGLLATFEAEAAALSDPKQRVGKLYKAAEVVEERMNKPDDAIARYNRCLQLVPGYVPAQQALVRIYEGAGRYLDLISMYEQELTQFPEREHAITTLTKMAVLYEDRLADPNRAVECLQRIVSLDPKHLPTIRALGRLFQKTRRWRDVIQTNELEATLTQDPKEQLALRHRNAEIFEEALDDRQSAMVAYQRLLEEVPSYLPALKALGRLYAQEGRWEDLGKMYRAEAEVAPSTDHAAALTYKVGELYEQKLNDLDAAIGAYREALTLAPSYFPGLRALERIYRSQQDWESLIEVWRAEAANRTDPTERANALFHAATIWEEKLQRGDMAAECYREVLRLTPTHLAANRSLERYYTTHNSVRELVAVLDREVQTAKNPASKLAPLLKLAYIYLDGLAELSRAAQCCEAALEIDQKNITALKLLERIYSTERERSFQVKSRLVGSVNDGQLRAAVALSSAAGSDGDPLKREELKRAFENDPGDLELALALEHQLRGPENAQELLEFYEKRLAALTDETERMELALRIADLARYGLGNFPKALEAYVSALRISPQLLPALQGTREVALALGDYAAAVKALEAEAAASRDPLGRLDIWIAAGCIAADKLDESDAAITYFQQALEIEPFDPTANAWLEQLLSQRGRGEELAKFHESAASAHLLKQELTAAAERLTKAAKVWSDQQKDRDRAIGAVERALQVQPAYPDALELQGVLLLEAGRHAEAAESLAARLRQGGTAEATCALNLKLGVLYQDHLSDSGRATTHLQAVLSADRHNMEALERLSKIYTQSGNWTGAVDCLARLLELKLPTGDLARHTLTLAKVFDEGLSDRVRAAELYRRALELGEEDLGIVDRLVTLHQSAGTLLRFTDFLDRLANRSPGTRYATLLRVKLGDLYANVLNQMPFAVASYRQAISVDPSCVPARQGLAEVLSREPAGIVDAIQEHREVLRIEPLRLESLHSLCRLWLSRSQKDQAFCAAGILYFMLAGSDSEMSFYSESRSRLPEKPNRHLEARNFSALVHPSVRNGVLEIIRSIGDQLSEVVPPKLQEWGVSPKTDRLKSSHPLHKLVAAALADFAVKDFEVYQAQKGILTVENTDPPSLCIGPDFAKLEPRQQRFFLGRAAFGLLHRTAFLRRLTLPELTELLGNSIRIHLPNDERLGQKNEQSSKQLRKRYSRKALRALEQAIDLLDNRPIQLEEALRGLGYSSDRTGLLAAGDVALSLSMVVRDSSLALSALTPEEDSLAKIAKLRPDLRELMQFAISQELFQLRAELGLSI